MFSSVYDFKTFYNTHAGRVVRRIITHRIRQCWPDVTGLSVLGCGYAAPYMRALSDSAERCFLQMPAALGAHAWPADSPNLVCMAEESELPFETNSIDRVLMIHGLEYSELIRPNLEEIWRVLKSNGRLVVIAPNRLGMWARAEWSPFGHGRPFSQGQLANQLRDCLFVQERAFEMLFIPPVRISVVFRAAGVWEGVGKAVYPALGGLHMIEASKQLYAPTGSKAEARVKIRGRGLLAPKPAGAPRGLRFQE